MPCENGVYNKVKSIKGDKVYVWKQKWDEWDGDTLNTNNSVDDLIKMRKLFVWRGKNSNDQPFTKEQFSNDGKQLTLNTSTEVYDKRYGLMSVVHKSGINTFTKDDTVHVNDRIKSNDVTRDTRSTIQQLISEGDLFVCDEIVPQSSNGSHVVNGPNAGTFFSGHGGKRKKSRKPKRRNSRSNRTLNKSKK